MYSRWIKNEAFLEDKHDKWKILNGKKWKVVSVSITKKALSLVKGALWSFPAYKQKLCLHSVFLNKTQWGLTNMLTSFISSTNVCRGHFYSFKSLAFSCKKCAVGALKSAPKIMSKYLISLIERNVDLFLFRVVGEQIAETQMLDIIILLTSDHCTSPLFKRQILNLAINQDAKLHSGFHKSFG